MYQVRLLDRSRKLLAVLDEVSQWSYNRRPSQATKLTVSIPAASVERGVMSDEMRALLREADKRQFAQVARLIQVYRLERSQGDGTRPLHGMLSSTQPTVYAEVSDIQYGARLVASGRISERSVGDEEITLTCHTEEILLEEHRTPPQYGRVFDGQDLADVARALLMDWHTQRVKDRSQWAEALEKVRVDIDTDPGLVMLAKGSGGQYYSSGYITLRFLRASVQGFVRWDRIRWLSDNAAPVRTTMQYRYGPDAGSMGAWSSEIEGALPDEIGVVPGTEDAAVLDVRINLYTDDTESEDPDGNPVGRTPTLFALEVIARTEGNVSAGAIPGSAGVTVSGLEADSATALSVLRDACTQTGWEFEVVDGRLNLAEALGTDRTSEFVLRRGTNMQVDVLGDDDADLCNILDAYGPGDGINRLHVRLTAPDSLEAYGPYPKSQEFDGVLTLAELEAAATEWLDEHSHPKTTFRIETAFDTDEEPLFGVGDTVRVVDPRNGIVTSARILEEERSYGRRGLKTSLHLNRFRRTLVDAALGIPRTRIALRPPVGLMARGYAGEVRLSWQPGRAERWEVWHTQETDGGGQPVNWRMIATVTEPRFSHSGLEIRSLNWYVVHALRGSERSEASDVAFAQAGDAIPPATPTGLVVEPYKLGVKARWNANTEPDLAGYRVQYRLDGGAWTTVFVGANTERLVQANPGVLVEFQVRAEDTSGNVSAYSPIQGATAQALDGGDYGDGTVDTVHIAQDAVSGLEILEVIDNTGAQTTSQSFVDIPGFAINVTLEQPATVLLYYTLDAYANNTASGVYGVQVDARLLVDGAPAPGSDRKLSREVVGHTGGGPDQWVYIRGTLAAVTAKELSAGSHTIKAQFRVGTDGSYIDPSKTRATAFHRILGAQIFKR